MTPPAPTESEAVRRLMEHRKSRRSCAYFVNHYCHVLDEQAGAWVPFRLWDGQRAFLDAMESSPLLVALKARQLGLTWAALAYVLWLVLFRPIKTVLVFSRRDDEAVDLLKNRLREMHRRLPKWLQAGAGSVDNDHEWHLFSGSRVKAFPSTAGDSYTASMVFVDEADLVPDLDRLLRAVKPTVDAGGQLLLLSRADKTRPQSPFKRIYRAARQGQNTYRPFFLDWKARPGRDDAWYAEQRADVLARTGALDDLHEQYPATDEEALAPRSLDKRIPAEWVRKCFREQDPLPLPESAPALPGLLVWARPDPGRYYAIGADPAEGNPTSDDSAFCVIDCGSGEAVAALAGRLQPGAFAAALDEVGRWYGASGVLVERNNHGHAVLLWLAEHSRLTVLRGPDGSPGWLSSQRGKALLYSACADACRAGELVLHDLPTVTQLQSIEGSTLRAPPGEHDDRADAVALAVVAGRAVAEMVMTEREGDESEVAYA